jgi:hypothetical protein
MYEGLPMINQDTGLVQGVVPAITSENVTPELKWTGTPFPRKLYLQTVAFARWCMLTHGGEVQGRLYYNVETNKWAVAILPQWMEEGLHSTEIEDHKDRKKSMRHVSGPGWRQNGTWHSHAHAGAGQSPTDMKDEIKQQGLHYTVGSLRNKYSSFDSRYSYRGLMYNLNDDEVMPSASVISKKCKAFPEEWKSYLHKAPKKETVYHYPHGTYGTTDWFDKMRTPNDNFAFTYKGVKLTVSEYNEFTTTEQYEKTISETWHKAKEITENWLAEHRGEDYRNGQKEVDTDAGLSFSEYLCEYYNVHDIKSLIWTVQYITGHKSLQQGLLALAEHAEQWEADDPMEVKK